MERAEKWVKKIPGVCVCVCLCVYVPKTKKNESEKGLNYQVEIWLPGNVLTALSSGWNLLAFILFLKLCGISTL